MTPKQKAVYDFIGQFIAKMGYSPSYKEIAVGLGIKTESTVHKHIQILRKRGLIHSQRNESRSIEIPDRSKCPRCARMKSFMEKLFSDLESGDLTISQARVLARKFTEG